ncbi:MAG: hypothetical protein U1D30_03295 [Planctomycetota bacterium]
MVDVHDDLGSRVFDLEANRPLAGRDEELARQEIANRELAPFFHRGLIV